MGLLPEGDHPLVVTEVNCINGKPSPQPSNLCITLPWRRTEKIVRILQLLFYLLLQLQGHLFPYYMHSKYIYIFFHITHGNYKKKKSQLYYTLQGQVPEFSF